MKISLFIAGITLILSIFVISNGFSSPRYYKNDGANIEFHFLVDMDEKNFGIEFLNQSGDIQRVEKKAIINSSDVAGISIENDLINFYFNRNSWQKIRAVTSSSQRKVALIKDGKIIHSAVLVGPIDNQLSAPHIGDFEITALLKGFSDENVPSFIEPEEVYIQFLKVWVIDNPNDMDAIYSLAYHYVPENDLLNCKDAIPYLQKIIESNTNDDRSVLKLIQCFFKSKNYDKALKVAEQWLANSSDDIKWSVYGTIGEIYFGMGKINKALENYKISLELLKKSKLPKLAELKDRPAEWEKLKEQMGWQNFDRDAKLQKDKMISSLEERIEFLKKEIETN